MKQVTLGKTGITVPQNAFGALPIQRVCQDYAVKLLRRAYEGGMRFFDTARSRLGKPLMVCEPRYTSPLKQPPRHRTISGKSWKLP